MGQSAHCYHASNVNLTGWLSFVLLESPVAQLGQSAILCRSHLAPDFETIKLSDQWNLGPMDPQLQVSAVNQFGGEAHHVHTAARTTA